MRSYYILQGKEAQIRAISIMIKYTFMPPIHLIKDHGWVEHCRSIEDRALHCSMKESE
jgi:hypothetical protein